MSKLEILNVSGIDCYEKDGAVYLKLEAVARGLGFTETAASGNECVRWRTVRKYLADLGVATSCDGDKLPDFIPENIFYTSLQRPTALPSIAASAIFSPIKMMDS